MSRRVFAMLALVLVAPGAKVRADGPLGPDGAPITTSAYALDLYQGPVFAGTRVTGLAGAYVAVAEDVDGNLQNPATPGVRPYYSVDHFDYWLGAGLSFPSSIANTDFFNTGARTELSNGFTSFLFLTPAMNLQWGAFGLGLTAELQNYVLTQTGQPTTNDQLSALLATTHIQGAYATLDQQLIFGYGIRILSMSIVRSGGNATGRPIFNSSGIGIEVGVLVRPTDQPFRIGAALRSRLQTEVQPSSEIEADASGDFVIDRGDGQLAYLPVSATLPWDVNVGLAYQFGRPLNPQWIDPADVRLQMQREHKERERQRLVHYRERLRAGEDLAMLRDQIDAERERDREELEAFEADVRRRLKLRYRRMQRRYLLLSTALILGGPVRNAVGVESFLDQTVNRSGSETVFSPRLGAESEVVADLLRLRLGGYLEPTRFDTSDPRMHFTLGGDLKLFSWDVFGLWPEDYTWRLSAALDVAPRYFVWALGIGGWH